MPSATVKKIDSFHKTILVIAILALILALFVVSENARIFLEVDRILLIYIAGIGAGFLGNFLHVLKKVLHDNSDKAIIEYIKKYTMAFVAGLVLSLIVVIIEINTYATDFGSLIWSALLTGYSADSLLEQRVQSNNG
jgi:drug/metabolite transporter (DMT)-like permease